MTKDTTNQRLFEIFGSTHRPLVTKIQAAIVPQAREIASIFYESMLAFPGAEYFLDHQLVRSRLHASLTGWIEGMFLLEHQADIQAYIQRQYKVGDVHARISVPLILVNHGMRVIKTEFWHRLSAAIKEQEELLESLALVNELLDYSSAMINEGYVNHRMVNERSVQAWRLQMMNHSLAVEIERLRSMLFDWSRKTVTDIYQVSEENWRIPSIYTSDFGLWVIYKAEVLFADQAGEFQTDLARQLQNIEELIIQANHTPRPASKETVVQLLAGLNEAVTRVAWNLSRFSEHTLETESNRDPLTRLYNRRFLPVIMQQVIQTSNRYQTDFAALLIDIDEFKQVNDTYGHRIGDQILAEVAETLITNVRANDFVFRYGGDEFLILLSGVDAAAAVHVAHKLHALIREHKITINDRETLSLTVSIGVAQYDGHPDYLRLIERADRALYQVKQGMRDGYAISEKNQGPE